MDWRTLLHDRRFQVGAVAVAGVGGFVLLRRKQTTGSTTSQPTGSTVSGGTVGTGFPDTSGTDLAAWLGTQSGQLASQQQQFLDTLNQSLGTGAIQNELTVPQGTYLYQWVAEQQKNNPGFNFDMLRQLNPGIDSFINWYDPGSPGNIDGSNYTPYLNQQTTIRVR